MKNEILELLRNGSEYISGQELCERFGVSRTAVWKAIEQLKKEGYIIEAVRNRGYRLCFANSDVYNAAEIEANIKTKYMGRKCYFYEQIGSTNTEAKRLADEGEAEGLLVVADQQTAGKGRRGRKWTSPKGLNAYFTIMLRPQFNPSIASRLTLLMAMAVADSISKVVPSAEDAVKIKWPNDIVVNGKKVCGILTEMSMERDYIQHVVIGTGINVRKQTFDEEIAATATSIDNEWGNITSRAVLVGNVMNAFEKYYELFEKTGTLSEIKEEYESYLVNKNKEVCVLDPKGEYRGIALGINDEGELLVKLPDGQVNEIYAGEVSVRGIYGYV